MVSEQKMSEHTGGHITVRVDLESIKLVTTAKTRRAASGRQSPET